MSYVVVLLDTDHQFELGCGSKVRVFGPYDDPIQAERARCRIHFDARQKMAPYQEFSDRMPRTYVKPIEQEPK